MRLKTQISKLGTVLSLYTLLGSCVAQAASVALIPMNQALLHAPSARKILTQESARASGPDFSEGSVLPNAVAALGNGHLFYGLFNTFNDPESARAYAIQRIRKTVRNYRFNGDPRPAVSVQYLVEVFKMRGGVLKREDLHHGTYPMSGFFKREVLKELEVGTGEVPAQATGDAWPFEPTVLYRLLQDYSNTSALYDSVRFDRSVSWKIEARFRSDGQYEVISPELGVDLRQGR
jgi:hypothetical protein